MLFGNESYLTKLEDVQLTAQEAWTTTDYRDDAFCVIGNAGGS